MCKKYCERLGVQTRGGCGLLTGSRGAGAGDGMETSPQRRRAEVPALASTWYSCPNEVHGVGFGGKPFLPSIPGDATCWRGYLLPCPGGQRALVLKSCPSSSSSDQLECALFWETHLSQAPACSFLASTLCANGTRAAPSPSYLHSISLHLSCSLNSTHCRNVNNFYSVL